MNKVKLFFQKLIPFIKKRGLRGVVEKILVKLHLKKEQFPLIEAYHFIVDEQKVPFDEKEFDNALDVYNNRERRFGGIKK